MIRHWMNGKTKVGNIWEIGNTVKIGFMTLEVTKIIPTPNDGMPDQYQLRSGKGIDYVFTPHMGLERVG